MWNVHLTNHLVLYTLQVDGDSHTQILVNRHHFCQSEHGPMSGQSYMETLVNHDALSTNEVLSQVAGGSRNDHHFERGGLIYGQSLGQIYPSPSLVAFLAWPLVVICLLFSLLLVILPLAVNYWALIISSWLTTPKLVLQHFDDGMLEMTTVAGPMSLSPSSCLADSTSKKGSLEQKAS